MQRRRVALTCALFAALLTGQAGAQTSTGLPQAFLLGSWTGGLFPPPSLVSAEQCLAQPTVIFTRDVVMRATLTDQFYVQRAIETARGTGSGIEFRFTSATPMNEPPPAMAGLGGSGLIGFGCENSDVLHVQRITPNEIQFPGCRDFPFPLVRCPGG
jgi:hypothetical protein